MKNTVSLNVNLGFEIYYLSNGEKRYCVGSDTDIFDMQEDEAYEIYKCMEKFMCEIRKHYDFDDFVKCTFSYEV